MYNKKNRVELLSPAGNAEKMRAAILYGADAVYLAGNRFGMRAAADNFTVSELYDAVAYAHERGVRVYLTLNTMPRDDEYGALEKYIDEIKDAGLDAFIIADLGVLSLLKRLLPSAEVHISTQASAVSSSACETYRSLGARRVVLSRELSLEEIARIRDSVSPELELEVFIHGSMCISYSGRCMISNYFTGRDANRGACTQPCRWSYKMYAMEEEKRPTDILGVQQTEDGTFVFSSRDLCMIEHIPQLISSGVDSFKIEGRMKSAYYAAVVTNSYRMATDAYLAEGGAYRFDPAWAAELSSVSHREYDTGFFFSSPHTDAKTVTSPGYIREKAYIASALGYDPATGLATFRQKNKLSTGDRAELLSPGKTGRAFTVGEIFSEDGGIIPSAPHPQMIFRLRVPFEVKAGDILRL